MKMIEGLNTLCEQGNGTIRGFVLEGTKLLMLVAALLCFGALLFGFLG